MTAPSEATAIDWQRRELSAWVPESHDRVRVQAVRPVELSPAQVRAWAAELVALAATVEGVT